MSNTSWRISGGIGVPPEEETQKITQGLGFPLRPVDGVPLQDSGDAYVGIPIATGLFTQWMGPWQSGQVYPAGSIVRDGDWLMVANVASVTKPAPVPDGNPTWSMSDTPTFATQSNVSVVYSGHHYTFTTAGWVKGLRIWVPELSTSTNYRIVVADITDPNAIITSTIFDPVLTEDAWKIVSLVDVLVDAGTQWIVYIDALNSGSDTFVTGGWNYAGSVNAEPPPVQGWVNRTQQDIIRISTTDLDSTDRTSELLGMTPGTTVVMAETARPERSYQYRVTGAATNFTTYVEFPVELTTVGGGGAPEAGQITTMTATVPVAQATQYSELAAGAPTPSWATVVGILEYDGVDQGGGANGYGVDLNFEPAVINPEWDIMNVGN